MIFKNNLIHENQMINHTFVLCLTEMITVRFEFTWYEHNGSKLKKEGGCYLRWPIWIDNKATSTASSTMKTTTTDIYFAHRLSSDYNTYDIIIIIIEYASFVNWLKSLSIVGILWSRYESDDESLCLFNLHNLYSSY